MKPIIIAILLVCGLLQAQADGNYIFDQSTGRVLGYRSSNGYIYTKTGQPLGFFQGDTLYNPSGQAIGYRSSNGYIYDSHTGALLGYFGN